MRFIEVTGAWFAGFGTARRNGGEAVVPVGPDSGRRRVDRYGHLAFDAASAAIRDAGIGPAPGIDPRWGICIGSSLGSWEANARYFLEQQGGPEPVPHPALFVRTVSNAANGDLAIHLGLGGPSETFVSGWTAGAEAIASAGVLLEEGRADFVLAGGVEAPGEFRVVPNEAGAMALMSAGPAPGRVRLAGYFRAHDPQSRWSLGAALDALAALRIGTIVVANTVPPALLSRWAGEAGDRSVINLPVKQGESGAAGTVAAIALAASASDASGTLVIARGPEGGLSALALVR